MNDVQKSWSAFPFRGHLLILLLIGLLPLILPPDGRCAEKSVTIAIVRDGASIRLDQRIHDVTAELRNLGDRDFLITFKTSPRFNAQWQADRVVPALQSALDDPDVDLVYAAGFLVSEAAADPRIRLRKPVVAGVAQDSELIGLKGDAAGHSTKENLTFICIPNSVTADIEAFGRLVPFKTLHVLVDERIASTSRNLAAYIIAVERKHDIQIRPILVGTSIEPALAQLADAEAAYLTLFPRLSPRETLRLIQGINRLNIPSFSILGRPAVEAGVLAGRLPPLDNRIRHRIALNIYQIMLGESPNHLNVNLVLPSRLMLNIETAEAIGLKMDMALLVEELEWVGRRKPATGPALTLEGAMAGATLKNPQAAMAADTIAGAVARRNRARSAFFPQVYGALQYRQIDKDRAATSFGNAPERLSSAGTSLHQVIFDDTVMTGFRTSGLQAAASGMDAESIRLDLMTTAGDRFLQVLSALAVFRIERNNLDVTQQHLQLAQVRRQVGTAGPEEIYRWEAEEAQRRAAVISARQSVDIAFTALAQSLGESQENRWKPRDITIGENESYFLDNRFHQVVNQLSGIQRLADRSARLALENAPEIRGLEKQILAGDLETARLKRRYFLPSLTASAGYMHLLDESGSGVGFDLGIPLQGLPSKNDNEWSVSLDLRLPLFEGGGRAADLDGAGAAVNRMRHRLVQTRQMLEQRARIAVFTLSKSWPSIFLARKAADRAGKNLDLVQDLYAQGKLNITDLVSAQNHRLQQDQNAALAVYRYLMDLVAYQRAIGWFEFEKTPGERDAMLKRLSE